MKSKHIVITGGSRGIGHALAKTLQEQGHRVWSLSRNVGKHEPTSQITEIPMDLAQIQSIKDAAAQLQSQINHIDILIHNAGCLVNKPFGEITANDWTTSYQINVLGVAQLTQALMPLLSKGSHVINTNTMGGVQGSAKFPGLAAYSSSKSAVITLFELLAEEYKDTGISFNCLALGAVQTEMLAEAFPGYEAPTTAEEMASYIAHFALNGAAFHNGKTLQVSSTTP